MVGDPGSVTEIMDKRNPINLKKVSSPNLLAFDSSFVTSISRPSSEFVSIISCKFYENPEKVSRYEFAQCNIDRL